jgi:succinate dehydrogenase flavin-adding protein (antitoxin of CptAB toxin-antitoxin module)
VVLLEVFGKSEKDDLSDTERREIATLLERLDRQLRGRRR